MRKFFNILICLSLFISTFDIIDVHDIELADTPVFTSVDPLANQTNDDMDDKGRNSIVERLLFSLPSIVLSHSTIIISKEKLPTVLHQVEYNKYSSNPYKPPIV